MGPTLLFRINLYSDYHVSAGHGLGAGVDSALLREADGVPVLRGTTLTGLLRDAVWRLVQLDSLKRYYPPQCQASGLVQNAPSYCGQYDPQQTDCPVCRLFGSPRRPKRWRIGSARPETLEAVATPKSAWKPAGSGGQVVQRVRVSPRTRRAEPRKLFAEEDGDSRLSFRFEAACESSEDSMLDDAALLVAAARFVRQLGRSRRRGRGECLIELLDVKGLKQSCRSEGQSYQDWLLARFESRWLTGQISQPTPQAVQPAFSHPIQAVTAKAGTEAMRLRLIVRTDEPLVVARRAEAGNQFERLPFIPGTAVRGALAALAATQTVLSESDNYRQFVALFIRGSMAFPFLYPTSWNPEYLHPAIPSPHDLLTCKARPGKAPMGHGIWGVARSGSPKACPSCDETLAPVEGFVSLYDRAQFQPLGRSELHIRIEPERGRVAPGDLFGYVPLEAGQYFVGDLVCINEEAWKELQRMTGLKEKEPFTLRLGKAARRGYGKVTAWLEPIGNTHSTWVSLPLSQRVLDPKQPLVLTLLTDTIVTDVWGRYKLGFEDIGPDGHNATWLIDELQLGQLEVFSIYTTTRPVDGFNDHLGLPRWRDLALTAGSAVGIRLLEPPADWLTKMETLERDGIGLRRNEGFGCIAFNHPVYPECVAATDSAIPLPEAMRLTSAPADHPLWKEREFREQWAMTLDQHNWKDWDEHFTALARWLHARQTVPPTELADLLNMVGEPDQTLKGMIGTSEYGARSKENFFQTKGKGLEGLDRVRTLLKELAQKDSSYWPIGVMMVAKRVASATVSEGSTE